MDVGTLIIAVGVATQFSKKALGKIGLKIEGRAAIVLSVLVSVSVVLVEVVNTDATLSFALLPVLIQVIIGSNMGYSLLKVAGGK